MVAIDFVQSFNKVTNYILYAAEAYQRLRVEEKVSRRSKLQWYSALADIYDEYRDLITKILSVTILLTLQRCKVTVLHLLDRELNCLKLT